LIYLDSCLVIYALEDPKGRGRTVRQMLAERADEEFAISPLVILECLVGVIQAGDARRRTLHEQYLSTFAMLPISPEVGAKAAELRAGFALKTPDALHLATALKSGCSALWTNDRRLARAAGDFAVAIV
jgi:predicted nucleic acid-binding protein